MKKDKNDRNSHSKLFAPSSSSRWRVCPASAVIQAYGDIVEEVPHPNTLRGTLAHNACEDVLRGTLVTVADAICRTLDGQKMDKILADEGQGYVDYVRQYMKQDPDAILFIEVRLMFSVLIGADVGEAFGAGDAIVVMPNLRKIAVIDLKTGKHVVKAENNSQLLFYGAGALAWFGLFWDFDTVEMVIYQRRPSAWEVSRQYVDDFINGVRPAVRRIKQAERIFIDTGALPDGYYTPSSAGCQWCKVLTCPHKSKEARRE